MKYYYTILALSWALTAYVVYHEHQIVTDLQQQLDAEKRIHAEENHDADIIISEQEKFISIVKDGASYTEAMNVIDASTEIGLDPKYSQR